ncbi:MAG: ATP synthase F1 subunit gamma [Lachnospiraceae bacterium]|nr:ATP synthase F1 subunit gamma [Lachnospiraceae bacterium]MBR4992677.1 ATP synthase F1 subunit gamma [Lachnospiraceae bacterium]
MASMRDIKRRRTSITSTQQITKAMKLVSTVKLQKAKGTAEKSHAYFETMYTTVKSILAKAGNINHRYLSKGSSVNKALILITSNRGLAGGYNSNMVKLILGSDLPKENLKVYAIGKRGAEALRKKGYEVVSVDTDIIEAPTYVDAMKMANSLLDLFEKDEIGEIYLAYTHFKNTVSHEPTLLKLLPVEIEVNEEEPETADDKALMCFEPADEEALDLLIPKYVTSIIYGALVEAVASENGARMQAMDSATNNAEEMIDHLTLMYNRARQGSITQELTEIIAGAEAIS